MTVSEELDFYVDNFFKIPESKGYWLIRTSSGQFYDSFKEFNYVGIEHRELKLSEIENISREYPDDATKIIQEFKNRIKARHKKTPEGELVVIFCIFSSEHRREKFT